MRMCKFTMIGTAGTVVYVNPMMVLNVVSYQEGTTTIYMAAGKADAIHAVYVVEPAEEVAGSIQNALSSLGR